MLANARSAPKGRKAKSNLRLLHPKGGYPAGCPFQKLSFKNNLSIAFQNASNRGCIKNIIFYSNTFKKYTYRAVYGKRENNNNDKHWYPTKCIIQKSTFCFSKITNHSWKHYEKQNPWQKPSRKCVGRIFNNYLIFAINLLYIQIHYIINVYLLVGTQ